MKKTISIIMLLCFIPSSLSGAYISPDALAPQAAARGTGDGDEEIESAIELAQQAAKQTSVDLNDLLRRCSAVCNVERENITINFDLMPDLPKVTAISGSLKSVFENLFVNASESMLGNGSIVVRSWQEDNIVCISISDTGIGIKAEDIPHIFDAYWTRDKESGTGLGLSIARGIIESRGGSINVQSRHISKHPSDHGTTFTVSFPADGKTASAAGSDAAARGAGLTDQQKEEFAREYPMNPGGTIRNMRKALDLLQRKFADLSGISIPMISLIERGKRPITRNTAKKLNTAFGVDFIRPIPKDYHLVVQTREQLQEGLDFKETALMNEFLQRRQNAGQGLAVIWLYGRVLGLQQRDFADKAGINGTLLSLILFAGTRDLTFAYAYKINSAFNKLLTEELGVPCDFDFVEAADIPVADRASDDGLTDEQKEEFAEEFPKNPGVVIRRMRETLDWTAKVLASKAKVSRPLLSMIESGKNPISQNTAKKMNDAFEVDFIRPIPKDYHLIVQTREQLQEGLDFKETAFMNEFLQRRQSAGQLLAVMWLYESVLGLRQRDFAAKAGINRTILGLILFAKERRLTATYADRINSVFNRLLTEELGFPCDFDFVEAAGTNKENRSVLEPKQTIVVTTGA